MDLSTAQWTFENDIYLFQNKDIYTKQILAVHFNKTVGAISSRLKHLLLEPSHKAYKRIHESYINRLSGSSNLSVQGASLESKRKLSNEEITAEVWPKKLMTEDPNPQILQPKPLVLFNTSNSNDFDSTGYNDLNGSQKQIVNTIIAQRKNVFITGAAGVGKSFVLRYLISQLQLKFPSAGQFAVTASTGIASTHISGQTLHSFAGIGLGMGTAETLFQKMSSASKMRWQLVECLVIDEVLII